MHLYVDESGDAGFQFDRGSSSHFVVALVLVEDVLAVHRAVDGYRHQLGWERSREFKFSAMSSQFRLDFLHLISSLPISALSVVVDKTRLGADRDQPRRQQYDQMVTGAVRHALIRVGPAHMVVDESFRGRKKQSSFSSNLRHVLAEAGAERGSLLSVAYRRSEAEPCLQVADAIAGAIGRAHTRGEEQYYRVIRRLLIEEHRLP